MNLINLASELGCSLTTIYNMRSGLKWESDFVNDPLKVAVFKDLFYAGKYQIANQYLDQLRMNEKAGQLNKACFEKGITFDELLEIVNNMGGVA